jgi:hypothetical protein
MHSIVPVLIPLLLFHCKRVDITDLYYLVRATFAEDQMSLFPEENVLTKEIESWKAFADSLKTDEEKELFVEMLGKCQKYALAINAKGEPFPVESLIMALLLEQHKMINWLQNKIPIRNKDSPSVHNRTVIINSMHMLRPRELNLIK